jgi:hypothetical protein
VALIVADPDKSTIEGGKCQVSQGYRSGEVLFLLYEVAEELFNVPIPEARIVFIDPEVAESLREIVPRELTREA